MIYLQIADDTHTDAVSHLIAALFREVGHTPDEIAIASVFSVIDADDRHSTLLALDDADDDVVGVLTVAESLALYAGGAIGVINELYVLPEYRSEGVGKMLLDYVKEIGEEREWVRLEVTTPGEEFDKTLRFYEREGFFKIGPRFKYEF